MSAQSKHGDIKNWQEWDNAESILNTYIIPEFTLVKNYGRQESYGANVCFEEGYFSGSSDEYKLQYGWIDGTHIGNPFYEGVTASIKLPDGSCLGINPAGTPVTAHDKIIAIDINGSSKAPNKAGYDLFFFNVVDNTIKPSCSDMSKDYINSKFDKNATANSNGLCCAAKVMSSGWKITYW